MVSTITAEQPVARRRPRMIVADDDAFVRAMLPAQLQDSFECVGTAEDSAAAIELVALEQPDIAILDVDMPHGGAIHATREIMARWPATVIVVLSGDEDRTGVIDLLQAGASSYLRKGVDPHDLAHHLQAALESPRRAAAA
jgi:two-component system chemotaxis response regulator CheY